MKFLLWALFSTIFLSTAARAFFGEIASDASPQTVQIVRQGRSNSGIAAEKGSIADNNAGKADDTRAIAPKVSICMGCHGIRDYRTAFPEVYRVPKLGGQNAQYIETALREYKNEMRKFSTMHAVAASLSDKDITDIGQYYAAQAAEKGSKPPFQSLFRNCRERPLDKEGRSARTGVYTDVHEDSEHRLTPYSDRAVGLWTGSQNQHGKMLVARNLCAACHGITMNQPISPDYPKLAGQHADYLYYAMRAYQLSNPLFGRNHPIMKAQVQNLSQRDLRDIAAYIEALPGDLVQKR